MGSFNGGFSTIPATTLGSIAIAEALKRIRLPGDQIDEVLMGCVVSAGLGQAPARQAAIGAGLPHKVGAVTVNKVCGSSLQTVMMAARAIALGETRVMVAGGMENMTRAPFLLEKARQGYRLGHGELTDSLIKDGPIRFVGCYLSGLVARSPIADQTMHAWMTSPDEFHREMGYGILGCRLKDDPDSVSDAEAEQALATIEREIHRSPNWARYAMNGALISIGVYKPALRKKAIEAARRIGKVDVDHGETNCKTPEAVAYIEKASKRNLCP